MTTAEELWRLRAIEAEAEVERLTGTLREASRLCEKRGAEIERLRAVVEAFRRLYREHEWQESDFEDGAALWEARKALAALEPEELERDEPLTPAEKEAVAMGCDPGDMLTPEEQEAL